MANEPTSYPAITSSRVVGGIDSPTSYPAITSSRVVGGIDSPTTYCAITSSRIVGGIDSPTIYCAITSSRIVCDKPPTPLNFSPPVQLTIEGFVPSKRINKVPRNPTVLIELSLVAVPTQGVRPLTSQFQASAKGRELVWQKVPSNPMIGLDYQKRQD